MNVGGINSHGNELPNSGSLPQQLSLRPQGIGLTMQQLLPQGANVISAEELEKRLRSLEDNTRFTGTHAQNYPQNISAREMNGETTIQNMSGLINPQGFPQAQNDLAVHNVPRNIIRQVIDNMAPEIKSKLRMCPIAPTQLDQ